MRNIMDTQAAAATLAAMENGEICCICEEEFTEWYGEPKACEDCGGDGVLESTVEDGGQFGMGA